MNETIKLDARKESLGGACRCYFRSATIDLRDYLFPINNLQHPSTFSHIDFKISAQQMVMAGRNQTKQIVNKISMHDNINLSGMK